MKKDLEKIDGKPKKYNPKVENNARSIRLGRITPAKFRPSPGPNTFTTPNHPATKNRNLFPVNGLRNFHKDRNFFWTTPREIVSLCSS
jgi:hypothetical protein